MRRPILTIAVLVAWGTTACAAPQTGATATRSLSPNASLVPSAAPHAASEEQAHSVQVYGDAHSNEFAGVYFDNANGGQLVARFTGHLERHQEALDSLLGSHALVVVVGAAYTQAALQAIVDSLGAQYKQLAAQRIQLMSASVDVIHNNVEIQAKSDDPRAKFVLQAYGQPGAVVVALYPADKPWTQPSSGPCWRLIGAFDSDLPYTVAVAVNPAQLATQWQRYGLPGNPPAWDPSGELAVILSEGIGSSCPELRLDGVVVDANARLVYGRFSDPLAPRVCTADLVGAKTFVVALAKDKLPPSPFTLLLDKACESGCGQGLSSITVDLR
jgi:hypothetical protein